LALPALANKRIDVVVTPFWRQQIQQPFDKSELHDLVG